jgi:hypothetical protein
MQAGLARTWIQGLLAKSINSWEDMKKVAQEI